MFFFSSRRRHTRYIGDWSSDVCSSDLLRRCQLGVSASKALGIAAGERPDPVAKIGLENLPINGPERFSVQRSEERRVGKECRCRWSRQQEEKIIKSEGETS